MLATLISAGLVCAGSLVVGQAVLSVCGVTAWSWLSAPVGLSVLMLIAVPALHLPGRAVTGAILLALALLSALGLLARERAAPPLSGLLAALPVALLVWVPFLSAGYSGTLGVSINNDMASHLGWAEAYRSADVAAAIEISPTYPLGAHALVASMAQGLGFSVDHVFAGLTAAIPVLIGLTALAALRPGTRWAGRAAVATVVGLPFLVAGYYGQGSFKELIQALLVLAVALELVRYGEGRGPLRWLPLGLLTAGIVSVYSVVGLFWPVAIATAWLAGLILIGVVGGHLSPRAVAGSVRRELSSLLLAAGITAFLLIPQGPRLLQFFLDSAGSNGTGIREDDLGNLAGPIPFWEAFAIWDNPDYRLGAIDPFAAGMWAAFVLALLGWGTVWWLRRGEWLIPAAAGVCFAIWALSDATQSPYVAAKALVILSPFVALLVVRPLVERPPRPTGGTPRWWVIAPLLLAAVLIFKAVDSTWDALRFSKVGSREFLTELRELRPLLGTEPTLFLGNDDFIRWKLAGARVTAPVISNPQVPIRPEKAWSYGLAHDFDSVDATALNAATWVITTRDAAGSAPPPQMRPVRRTRSFQLWRREGSVIPRAVLSEGEGPAAKLDCSRPGMRAIARQDGEAGVRLGSVGVPVPAIVAGTSSVVRLTLTAGSWELSSPYVSALPIRVQAPGIDITLPPHLSRPGPRYPAGRLTLTRPARVAVRLTTVASRFTPESSASLATSLIATPTFGQRTVPLRRACGQLVDWYRPSPD